MRDLFDQDDAHMFREVHGRVLNNVSEYYVRPTDEIELDRSELQHQIMKAQMGGLYIRPDLVEEALKPKPDLKQAIMDIGTGTGSWAIEMGRKYPKADVLGLDLVPVPFKQIPPANCRFELDDVNWGLSHYKNTFDVVHARFVCTGLKNYYGMLEDAAIMLRPRGVFLSLEGDMQLYDENKQKVTAVNPGEPGFSWLQKFFRLVVSLMKEKVGTGSGSAYLIPTWLKVQGNWEDSGTETFMCAVGPWEPNMTEENLFISESMRQNFLTLVESYRPLMLNSSGMKEPEVDELIANVKDELVNLRVRLYAQFHSCWAIRKKSLD